MRTLGPGPDPRSWWQRLMMVTLMFAAGLFVVGFIGFVGAFTGHGLLVMAIAGIIATALTLPFWAAVFYADALWLCKKHPNRKLSITYRTGRLLIWLFVCLPTYGLLVGIAWFIVGVTANTSPYALIDALPTIFFTYANAKWFALLAPLLAVLMEHIPERFIKARPGAEHLT